MLPYLHKYIANSPSLQSTSSKVSKRSNHKKSKPKKPKHVQRDCKESIGIITSSSDTVHSQSRYSHKSVNSKSDATTLTTKSTSPTNSDEHKYNQLPSTSESKVIFIKTKNETDTDSSKLKSSSNLKKKSRHKVMKYWTVSIASKHNEVFNEEQSSKRITMGFGICDVELDSDDILISELNTNQLLKTSNYGYGYCVTYSDNHKYQSYHTKLKSLDDILIAFNQKTNKLTLWQNGKRFNRTFQLQSSKMYGFGIKLYGDDYCIKILPNTGN